MDGKPAERMSVSGQVWSVAHCIRWGQGCGHWSSQAWRVVLNAQGGCRTFLPTTSYPVPPGKPQLTTGALENETKKTTGQARTARQPTQRRKKQGVGPFGGLVVGADGGIKILIAFWHDFVKGGEQACGFSHSSQYNGGEAWRGRNGLAWGFVLKGRNLTKGICFHTHRLKNNGYENCFKDYYNTDVTSKLGVSYLQYSIIAEMTAEMKGHLKRQSAGEKRMWTTH